MVYDWFDRAASIFFGLMILASGACWASLVTHDYGLLILSKVLYWLSIGIAVPTGTLVLLYVFLVIPIRMIWRGIVGRDN